MKLRSSFLLAAFALALLLLPCTAGAQSGIYTAITYDYPGAQQDSTIGLGVNDNGAIVGQYADANSVVHGFLLSGGTYTSLTVPGSGATYAWGINLSGVISGYYVDGGGGNHGFTYIGGSFSTIDYPGTSGLTQVYGINNSGEIAGSYTDSGGNQHGFTSSGGSFTTIDYPGATTTIATGVNNAGLIAGTYIDSGGDKGFLYNGSTFTSIDFNGIGRTTVWGVNNSGYAAGLFNQSASFIYSAGRYVLVVSPSNAVVFGINNLGQIVGYYFVSSAYHGFLGTPVPSLKNNGRACDSVNGVQCGDPITIANGNVFEQATDYITAGQNPLAFTRYYNSLASNGPTFATSLGVNWRSNFDRYLQLSSSTVIAERADGQQLTFTLSGSSWVTDSDVDVTLANAGSTWTLTDHDDTMETYTTTSTGTEALLNSIKSRNGYTQTLHYNGSNQLTSVTDPYSRSLVLAYNGNGTLNTVSTPDSTTLTYGYTAGGSGQNLTSITYPTSPSSVLTYTYGEGGAPANALTGITDENSNRYGTWTYDSASRGTSSKIGTGTNARLTSISYDDSTGNRTVINPFGVHDTYSFTVLQNVPKASQISRAAIGTITAATRNFTYDTNGYLKTATDWNGNQTTYTNDTHGDPTKIVEPTRTTTIGYYTTPLLLVHLPKTITTTGLTSTLVYDTSTGNLLTRTDKDTTSQSVPYSTNGQTRTWTYTWSNYLLASVQNPRTDVTAITNYGYGSDGALTSITDALTHATNITQHTGGGRPLTIVDPNSVTTTLTYDARQRLTSSAVTTSAGVLTTTYTIDPAS